MNNNSNINLIVAFILSLAIMLGWHFFYEKPRIKEQTDITQITEQKAPEIMKFSDNLLDHDEALKKQEYQLPIKSGSLSGSINLKGLKFDNLTLLSYKENLEEDSKAVNLLSPQDSKKAYFIEIGWIAADNNITTPNNNSIWQIEGDKNQILTPDNPVTLFWISPEGIEFRSKITLDNNYLFNIEQKIINKSTNNILVKYYGLINRNHYPNDYNNKAMSSVHQGAIAVLNDELHEISYSKIKDEKSKRFTSPKVNWLGITDKYWLTAIIPVQSSLLGASIHEQNSANIGDFSKIQVDFLSNTQLIASKSEYSINYLIFAGAKKVNLLDKYEKIHNIKFFDRAIDFGWFYILTKPIFAMLNFFYSYVGNFGVSILLVTILIKILMFAITNKSYLSIKKMKKIQPEIARLQTLYKDNKTRLNQEVMALYKKEKVNPVSGCLPILLQIPVFFSIYKVLSVTIEMRQAPFFWWIKDLSEADPTSVFNLFGLINIDLPNFLMIGALPIFMSLTMFLQQKFSPAPTDPVQAQVMKFLPIIFLVMFSKFPAGLLIYWSWSNILSILQQYYIDKKINV